jgi:hypothetical protein
MHRLLFPAVLLTLSLFPTLSPAQDVGADVDRPGDVLPDGSGDTLKKVYDMIRRGDVEAIRAELASRGLSTEGDLEVLAGRLLADATSRSLPPYEERVKTRTGDDIVLERADFIRTKESEGEKIIQLRGNIRILTGSKTIEADEVTINSDREFLYGRGNVRFTEGKDLYVGESFFFSLPDNRGFFFDTRTAIDQFIYRSDTIGKIDRENRYIGRSLSLSTCNLRYPHYHIDADALYYYDEDRVLIQNARLYYGQDEVIRLPYIYRRIGERKLRTFFQYRQRSGLVIQNTYTPVDTELKQLVLKGDFYERLGFYSGLEYGSLYERGETQLDVSAALSNDVFLYNQVTEGWSPLGPPGGTDFSIHRSLRYGGKWYQELNWHGQVDHSIELELPLVSDPYYTYDFERRSVGFDLFELLRPAEDDDPRKGSGYSLSLSDTLQGDEFSLSVRNTLRFEPQRNLEQDIASLPDYYEYRPFTLTSPRVSFIHTTTIFDDVSYTGRAAYANSVYYNDRGAVSDQVQSGDIAVSAERDFTLGRVVRFTPDLELGAEGQSHLDGDGSELADDRRNSLVYGRTTEELRIGSDDAYVSTIHDLKYKLYGPSDQFTYHRFRIHDVVLAGFLRVGPFTEKATTSYDLRRVYDWQTGEYQSGGFDKNRFEPLKNTVTFNPSERVGFEDYFVYDIADSEPSTNRFSFSSMSGEFGLIGTTATVSWDLDWMHYFQNPTIDNLDSTFRLDVRFRRYMTAYFTALSRNEDLWKYQKGTVNPIVDLVKSFNFFNRDDREESNFKLKSISFGLVRDLHDWELKLDYTGNRELSYDATRYIWDNTFSISLGLREVPGVTVHTTLDEKR